MKCYMCDEKLNSLEKSEKFVSICNKCIKVMEKSEARQTNMITKMRALIKEIEARNLGGLEIEV